MVGVFKVLHSLEETGRAAMSVVKGIHRVAMVVGTSRVAVVVAAVIVVGIGASMNVGIAALENEKGSSNFLILNCFLLAWWFTFLHLFFASLVLLFLGVCASTNGDLVGLLG